jgi:hypothetical protein
LPEPLARREDLGMRAKRCCEVCGQSGRVVRLSFGSRTIALCSTDAERAKGSGAATLDDLRRVFREAGGRRALLPRRAPEERRLFPPRPEGRRHDDGRRGSDPA